jgi:DNA invertase Pin-like site-specific DNA recombinase
MNELTRNEIVRRWQAKQSMRQIAAQLKLSRHTVRRVLTDHQTQRREGVVHPDLPHPVERRPSLLDVYEETC